MKILFVGYVESLLGMKTCHYFIIIYILIMPFTNIPINSTFTSNNKLSNITTIKQNKNIYTALELYLNGTSIDIIDNAIHLDYNFGSITLL